ncbi:MAG: 16S rRNA (guanine(966)-N(2))-methyltransferase RsmD [Lachnospiraceae bacterium]|nr:16S rRNA (guanine(966)-N(2))-methyltransferase RsmD [Lachnospiraceae bacterium]
MRVIAGKARRLLLKTIEGNDTRPTTDRIKETLFNMINNDVPGARFLDLFAGSGGIGIEALSRGAAFCAFVENNPKAANCIRDNLSHTKLSDDALVLEGSFNAALKKLEGKGAFDIVFMDPPYASGYERQVLEYFSQSDLIIDDTVIIIEAALDTDFSWAEDMGYRIEREKLYKTNKHIFVSREGKE